MKCPVCGHKVRPSKKYPGKYLCDTCRKRFPASAVIPDDTDTRSARSSAHKHESVSGKKRPAARQQAFFDDPLNGPEIYHSTAAAMRSMRKNVPEAEEAEVWKKEVQEAFPELEITRMDPLALSIVCHTGPGVLAIAGSHCVAEKSE